MAKRLMKNRKAPLSPGQRVLRIFFVLLVILAALIVIAYGAFRLLAQPPKIAQETPPPAESANTARADHSPAPSQSAQPTRQRKEYTYTFLLCASDQSSGNVDTMIVATYDTANQTHGDGLHPPGYLSGGGDCQRKALLQAVQYVPL